MENYKMKNDIKKLRDIRDSLFKIRWEINETDKVYSGHLRDANSLLEISSNMIYNYMLEFASINKLDLDDLEEKLKMKNILFGEKEGTNPDLNEVMGINKEIFRHCFLQKHHLPKTILVCVEPYDRYLNDRDYEKAQTEIQKHEDKIIFMIKKAFESKGLSLEDLSEFIKIECY